VAVIVGDSTEQKSESVNMVADLSTGDSYNLARQIVTPAFFVR
jgi:hypothetical protein